MDGPAISTRMRAQVLEVVTRASELLDEPTPAPAGPAFGEQTAHEWLDNIWQSTATLVSQGGVPARKLPCLMDLLAQVRACETALHGEDTVRWTTRRHLIGQALDDLSTSSTVAGITQQIPESASRIGFDRTMFSRIDDTATWTPESMFVTDDERWAQEILAVGRANPRTLDDSLLETQIARHRQALVVPETAPLTNLHQPLINITRTRSYVAAPVTDGERVIGFIHADCYYQHRHLTPSDRDLLWMYCDGLSQLLARTGTLETIQTFRYQVLQLLDPRSSTQPWLGVTPAGPAPREPHGHLAFHDLQPPFMHLSRREVEVVHLMGRGMTNASIGNALFISEGTVKTHVKHILKKLGAANRAEAVSIWLSAEKSQQQPQAVSAASVRPDRSSRA